MSSDDEHNIYMDIRRIEYSEDYEDIIVDTIEEDDVELDFSNLSCVNNEPNQTITIFMILRTEKSINIYRNIYTYKQIKKLSPIFNNISIFTKMFDSMYDIDEYILSHEFVNRKFIKINFNIVLNDIINEIYTIHLDHIKTINKEPQVTVIIDSSDDSDYEIVDY